MNKQTIITILFALVAVAGQGQVKSGLDLCLRDEATGDWLIGLFDDYAVYNCEIWEYATSLIDIALAAPSLHNALRPYGCVSVWL